MATRTRRLPSRAPHAALRRWLQLCACLLLSGVSLVLVIVMQEEPLGPGTVCWQFVAANLESLVESVEQAQRCRLRFHTLAAAQHACQKNTRCGGVTRDAGLQCDGDTPLRFELRAQRLDRVSTVARHRATRPVRETQARKHLGVHSWLVFRNAPVGTTLDRAAWCRDQHSSFMRDQSPRWRSRRTTVKLPHGLVTRAVARPKLAWPFTQLLHTVVGDGVVLELTQSLSGREIRPPFSLLRQRIPTSWRKADQWRLSELSGSSATGRFLTSEELCGHQGAHLASALVDWAIVLDMDWPVGCTTARTARALELVANRGVVIADDALAKALVQLGLTVDVQHTQIGRDMLRNLSGPIASGLVSSFAILHRSKRRPMPADRRSLALPDWWTYELSSEKLFTPGSLAAAGAAEAG
jgi:hypothetical protein